MRWTFAEIMVTYELHVMYDVTETSMEYTHPYRDHCAAIAACCIFRFKPIFSVPTDL